MDAEVKKGQGVDFIYLRYKSDRHKSRIEREKERDVETLLIEIEGHEVRKCPNTLLIYSITYTSQIKIQTVYWFTNHRKSTIVIVKVIVRL